MCTFVLTKFANTDGTMKFGMEVA